MYRKILLQPKHWEVAKIPKTETLSLYCSCLNKNVSVSCTCVEKRNSMHAAGGIYKKVYIHPKCLERNRCQQNACNQITPNGQDYLPRL